MKNETEYVDVNNSLIKELEVSPFQRKLDKYRIPSMARQLGNGTVSPPILIAQISGKKYVIDWQHRLAAWQEKNFPLKAVVVKMESMKTAAHNFIEINRTARRVNLRHRLAVDPGEYATKLRKVSERYKCDITKVNCLLFGIVGSSNFFANEKKITGDEWRLLELILNIWMKDVRWNRTDSKYSANGILMSLGRIVKKSKNPENILKKLKNLDFACKGTLGYMVGSHGKAVTAVLDYMYRYLAKDIL